MEYNGYMSRNNFSKPGSPFYINDGLTHHDHDHIGVSHTRVSFIDRVKAFFKSRPKKRNK